MSKTILLNDKQLYILSNYKQNNNYIHENIQNEIEPNEIDLNSFKQEQTLHPKLWEGENLDSRVRLKLLDIADDFYDTLEIDWIEPIDVILTGSICNYNWSNYSDIDVHIVLDFKKIGVDTDLLRDYFNTKKNMWAETHDELSIYDMDVELYVEDCSNSAKSNGVYSLEKNKWIKKPNKNEIIDLENNEILLRNVSSQIMTCVDNLHNEFLRTNDKHQLQEINDALSYILTLVYKIREKGLNTDGELSPLNIIFKIIRRGGYIILINDIMNKIYDKINSID